MSVQDCFLVADPDEDSASSMSDIGSTSTLSRRRIKSSRKRCDLAMCHIGLLMVAITGIDVKSLAIARDEAILEEQTMRKKRAVSFTKHKAEPVLTGYRAGSMWKSNSISSDEPGSGSDGIFNLSPLSEKHRTQSLGRRPWSKSASQPEVDGVYYKRIDSDSSVFTESESTRSTAPLLSNSSRTKYDRATKGATKHALKSKSSDSLPRNLNQPETRTKSPADARGSDQRYSLPDIESQLPVTKLPPPPSSNSNRDLSRSSNTALLLELNGGKSIRPRPRAQKNSSSTDESMTPTGLTPESEAPKGFDNLGKDESRPRVGRTASQTITDL